MTYSYTQISQYLSCPRRYKHRYRDGWKETDTRAAIKRFTAIFEPVVILVMGVLIGSLILSMLLAITSINDVQI